ncbi:DUF4279 domain-containing protein [Arenimonas aestuarii]
MNENFCSVSLYLYGADILHDEATKLLGITPTRVRRRGEVRVTSSGTDIVHKTGSWEHRARVDYGEISSHAASLFKNIKCSTVVGFAGIEKAELDVFVPLGTDENQGGFAFEMRSDFLSTLSVLGVDLIVTAR